MNNEKKGRAAQAARIRLLNDNFRRHGIGRGSIMVTSGIEALGKTAMATVIDAVRRFDQFDANNDPYHEHDFGKIEIVGETIFFKIDYYDRSLGAGSPDPADEAVTQRVLRIMLASEY